MQNNNQLLAELRHSAAHLLAAAVKELYPAALPTLGPAIDTGFYYDFDQLEIGESDLEQLEAKMRELVKDWDSFARHEVSEPEAKTEYKDNPYKLELIQEFHDAGEQLSIYQASNFRDLCRGGHAKSPAKDLTHFKLLSIAGAYWRGDEKNKMLTRIYGTAFFSQKDLDEHLHNLEEAKKRDHRKLGRELDLFTISGLVGSGLPLYTPKGTILRRAINDYIESVQSNQQYTQVWTPQIAKASLFKTSGHYDKYKGDMFRVVSNYSDEEMFLKPMNCPQHAEIYKSQKRSYRDLPLRLTDFAMLYRDEKPGELNGLARVRAFSQDDCHVYCREDQVDAEVDMMLAMTKQIMQTFGFKYRYRLSTRDPEHPENYLGDPKEWDMVEEWAVKIMKRNGIEYFDAPGEAAFYAPKMDLMATDSLGREWQLSTVQIDYVQPRRFDLTYTAQDGSQKKPVTLHRAIAGSSERLMMILIEHFGGAFPLWLAPVQVALLTVSESEVEYAQYLAKELKAAGIRVELDDSDKSLGKKLALALEGKHPYLGIIGAKEAEDRTLTLKNRHNQQETLALDQAIAKLTQEVQSKSSQNLL